MAPGFLLIAIVFSFILFLYFVPLGLWFQSGVSIGFGNIGMVKLIIMRFRKISPRLVVNGIINLHRAGLDFVTPEDLEAHYLAGGDINQVVESLIAADKANIDLTFKTATAIDLAGRDVKEAVQTSVYPKVIDCPKEGKVSAVAQDGIQLLAKGRVTVRTNIEQLVGGATDDTVIARVGEGIVSAIGSAPSYKSVLENPDNISRSVLSKGLDSGTAYSILSIDIADVDVGQNIGAQLEADQAEADKKVAQAKAESRRAMAVAAEQENRARVEEMQAKVVESEAQVPLAMAEAFRSGNLGIMDYYNMKNVMADTSMRTSIAKDDKDSNEEKEK
ncbi:MAG: flotillin-like protein FloA [Candidatus Neomarinimicrobiota bacterium]|nr:flotillin-like protein FloA [Candidatus Neomarinimicrobiota bacterium]